MPEHNGLQGDGLVDRGPPDDEKPKRRPRRPAKEFSPAGSRGDDPITRNLKRVYEEVAAEPIPDDIMKLLNQLGPDDGTDKEGGNG